MLTRAQRIRARPLEYAKKGIDPRWWVRRVADYPARKKRSLTCRMETEESQRVLGMLYEMNAGTFPDAAGYRLDKLSQILLYAGEHCRYYRDVFQATGFEARTLDGFERLPLLDKAVISAHRDELASDDIASMGTYVMNTGGSTGEPLEFLASRFAALIDGVHQEFVYRVTMQYQAGDTIVAFDGSSVPANLRDANVFWITTSDDDVPYGRLSYSSLYLRAETLPYYMRHLFSTAPCILRGYPSAINDIAEYILEENISVPFRVKGIQLTAEQAHDWQIENIRKAFNTKVHLQYGHSEVCVYGYTFDDTYEYHCSPFYGYTEVLDADGKHVNVGDVGEVVATGFYSFAMPFVRYRTGDLAVFGGDENGIVKLRKMTGRTQDFVLTKDGAEVAITALVFGQHYHAFRNIRKWQLQQEAPGKVTVRIVKGEAFSTEDEMEIRAKFMDICGVDTDFEYVDLIPLTPRGKHRFLIRSTQL